MKTFQNASGRLSASEAMDICVEARYLALGMAMIDDGGSARLNARTERLRAELVEWADEFTEMLDVALEWREIRSRESEAARAERRSHLTVVPPSAA